MKPGDMFTVRRDYSGVHWIFELGCEQGFGTGVRINADSIGMVISVRETECFVLVEHKLGWLESSFIIVENAVKP